MSKARSLTDVMKEKENQDINENAAVVISWMEEKLGEQLPKQSFRELIFDGMLFCRLANALKPGCVRKFHRKPKLLMMQIENAGFFLNACKTRFGLNEAALFQPTDVQDESEETGATSLRKILGVLDQLRKDYPGSNQTELSFGAGEEGVTFDEPDPDAVDAPVATEPEPKVPEPEPAPAPAPQPGAFTESPGAWYLNADVNSYKDFQSVVLPIIQSAIHNELSFESKKSLLDELQEQVFVIHKRLAAATDEELRRLAHEYGLGNTLADVPSGKDRKWYIDWILKYGRTA